MRMYCVILVLRYRTTSFIDKSVVCRSTATFGYFLPRQPCTYHVGGTAGANVPMQMQWLQVNGGVGDRGRIQEDRQQVIALY